MAPHVDEDGIEPPFGFRVLEIVASDPRHKPVPVLGCARRILFARVGSSCKEPRAAAPKLTRYFRRRPGPGLQRRTSPIRKGLPIDISSSGLAKAIRLHQLRR